MNSQATTQTGDENAIRAIHQRMIDTWNTGNGGPSPCLEGGEVKFVHFLGRALGVMDSVVRVTLPGQTNPSPSRDSMRLTVVRKRKGDWHSGVFMNARKLVMERQYFLDELNSLPVEAPAPGNPGWHMEIPRGVGCGTAALRWST